MFETMTEERRARLREVFALVKPPGGWKNPIQATVAKEHATEAEIADAVIFFCGGMPDIEDRGDHWYVTGAGYYIWIGA